MDHAWQQPAGGERDLALHEARKAAKRARYAGEALAPAFGQPAERFAKQMKKMTSLLGEHQDAVVARQLARELGIKAHLAGENAFTYGLLHERAAQAGQRAQAKARKAWRKAARRRYRRWLS
jgi:CHAD domain-containing protein